MLRGNCLVMYLARDISNNCSKHTHTCFHQQKNIDFRRSWPSSSCLQGARFAPLVRAIFFLARSYRRACARKKTSSRTFCVPKIATRSYVTLFRNGSENAAWPFSIPTTRVRRVAPRQNHGASKCAYKCRCGKSRGR